ncbi:MAG: hypothetical protein RLZZ230_478 [Candidatus Parcubacteria bacterium]|jgi:predicted ferric reductase
MFDLIRRAACHPADYVGVMKKRNLTLLKVTREVGIVYTFVFKLDCEFDWLSGQHGVFNFPKFLGQGKSWRAFSIASAGFEKTIQISTMISDSPSDFKKQLLSLKPGDKINMHGPFGEFHLTKDIKHAVCITGGIGITPFRSLIEDVVHRGLSDVKVDLLYGSNDGTYVYQNELDSWQTNSNIKIHCLGQKEEVQDTLLRFVKEVGNEASYFISGAPIMVIQLRALLKANGIKNIINDPFKGF